MRQPSPSFQGTCKAAGSDKPRQRIVSGILVLEVHQAGGMLMLGGRAGGLGPEGPQVVALPFSPRPKLPWLSMGML
jgi:hypothetical protein